MERLQPHVLEVFKTLSMLNRWSAYLLVSLEPGEATSVEISRRIGAMTNGDVVLAPGSANESAKHAMKGGWIMVAGSTNHGGKIYKLTGKGKEMVTKLHRISEGYERIQASS